MAHTIAVLEGDQTGQDQSGGPDSTAGSTKATGADESGTEADGPGGNADPAGSTGQDGNFNN